MNKSTILILLIISTILSVAIILLNYFGISRFLFLHMCNSKKYIEKYSKLPELDKERKTKIAIETNSDKIKKIKPVLNSILDQTCKVNGIILLVPKNTKVPDYIKKIANIDISTIKNTLLKQKEANTDIVQLKDDIVYGKDFLEQLTKKAKETKKNLGGKHSKLYKVDRIDVNNIDKTFSDLEKFNYSENYKRF